MRAAKAAPFSSRFRSLANTDLVDEIYELARRANHRELRTLLHDDVTWHPAREDAWRACTNADEVVQTMLWRSSANRLRPGEMLDLGGLVFVQLRGKRLERIGGKGFVPKLFQVIAIREGKVVSIKDYARRTEALEAAGVKL
jgi:ketosteroid isomerase-like protein